MNEKCIIFYVTHFCVGFWGGCFVEILISRLTKHTRTCFQALFLPRLTEAKEVHPFYNFFLTRIHSFILSKCFIPGIWSLSQERFMQGGRIHPQLEHQSAAGIPFTLVHTLANPLNGIFFLDGWNERKQKNLEETQRKCERRHGRQRERRIEPVILTFVWLQFKRSRCYGWPKCYPKNN